MNFLYLHYIRFWARSQRVGIVRLVGRVSLCCGINGEVAFLFRATCSTGASNGIGSSTGAARRGREGPLDGGRGAVVREPFPPVLDGEVGVRVPDGLSHRFWSSPWAGGGINDEIAGGSLAPLTAPGAHGFFVICLLFFLSPKISVTEPRLPSKATRNSVSSPKVASIAPRVRRRGETLDNLPDAFWLCDGKTWEW